MDLDLRGKIFTKESKNENSNVEIETNAQTLLNKAFLIHTTKGKCESLGKEISFTL